MVMRMNIGEGSPHASAPSSPLLAASPVLSSAAPRRPRSWTRPGPAAAPARPRSSPNGTSADPRLDYTHQRLQRQLDLQRDAPATARTFAGRVRVHGLLRLVPGADEARALRLARRCRGAQPRRWPSRVRSTAAPRRRAASTTRARRRSTLKAGDVYGFRMSGTNYTGGPVMSGSLELQEVDATRARRHAGGDRRAGQWRLLHRPGRRQVGRRRGRLPDHAPSRLRRRRP